MTTSRDPDRLIHAFLLEGAEDLPDGVYDAVRADIDRKRQRVVIGPWRIPALNKIMPFGVGAAVVVVALVVGARLLPSAPTSPGASPSVRPSASPSAPASPSTAAGPRSLLIWQADVTIHVNLPSSAWRGDPGNGIVIKNDNADPPDGAGMILFVGREWFVPSNPCTWKATMPASGSTTVDAVVAALAAQADRTPSAPTDITIDGHRGKSITLHVPADAVLNRCDGGMFCTLGNPRLSPSDACHRYAQGPGQIDTLAVVQVDRSLVIVDYAFYAGTPATDRSELESILRSMTFG